MLDTAHCAFQFRKQYIEGQLSFASFEAFRTVEDIYGLMSMVKKMPKSFLMAVYYAKLIEIFSISSSHLYHAYTWFKLFLHQKSFNKNLNQQDLQLTASSVVVTEGGFMIKEW
ncbi:eukaryotic translation initiation factor 3 subunit A [Artemisia annua]|uniref:Eukaryotic translation initiation factor 3 subunit A n=1 Tax=Artemisia annua TaxID=35608 RepID=A0A2U1L4J7_ARTAN|nr:eukaryotic translation initiation factor 3 subunit A [Artemisia annua]